MADAQTADVIVETDFWGVDSHGISLLAMDETMMREGRLKHKALPKVVNVNAVIASIDGDAGLGHPVACLGMQMAIERALGAIPT